MQQQVFTSKQATNMLSSLPLCICMDSVRGQSCIVLHTLSIRLATKCIAYTEYKASIVLSCKHCIQGQQCIVLHTRLAMLCTAARKHNTSNVLHCMQGIQGWSYSVMHAQGPIPVMYSTHFNAFNTFQCIQYSTLCIVLLTGIGEDSTDHCILCSPATQDWHSSGQRCIIWQRTSQVGS